MERAGETGTVLFTSPASQATTARPALPPSPWRKAGAGIARPSPCHPPQGVIA